MNNGITYQMNSLQKKQISKSPENIKYINNEIKLDNSFNNNKYNRNINQRANYNKMNNQYNIENSKNINYNINKFNDSKGKLNRIFSFKNNENNSNYSQFSDVLKLYDCQNRVKSKDYKIRNLEIENNFLKERVDILIN